jgi:hypothetical protein
MSGEAAARAALGPNSYGRARREARQRKAVMTAIVAVLLAATFVLVTGQTGFPGPGPMRRYRTAELQALADRLNHLSCTSWYEESPANASVDWVRARVHLDHPEKVLVAPGDRPMIENPELSTADLGHVGIVPTWSMAACPSHSQVG